ncbi:MAG: prolipoprotein diacylglyceryl transferase [Myxococcaceae bacterium]|nr:prolipoprotein diacylglyceryl transferase [Myxococcaceae bacterium]
MALSRAALGPVLYGALFVAVIPAAMVAWSLGAAANVHLPVPATPRAGWALVGFGLVAWAAGTLALRTRGGGLPMNAYPPPRLVTSGVFALVGHPLYLGATCVAAGLSIALGSAAGVWLVTPTLGLSTAALWWGYERQDLRARLGPPPRAPAFGVPFATDERPTGLERLGALSVALLAAGVAATALFASGLGAEALWRLPVGPAVTGVAIAVAGLAAVLTRTARALRELALSGLLGVLVVTVAFLVLPAGPSGGTLPVAPGSALTALVLFVAAFSLAQRVGGAAWHGALAGVGAVVVLAMGEWALVSALGPPAALLHLTSPARTIADTGGPALLGLVAAGVGAGRGPLYRLMLRACEWFANCWREHDFGAVRVLHIGWLAALPSAFAAGFAVTLLGPGSGWLMGCASLAILVGAALWAQTIEGSPALSRPYGFFGGLLGAVGFAVVARWLGFDTSAWVLLAVWGVVAPWTQGASRLRCFANGCCHGAPSGAVPGVVYRHPRTRVVRLAHLEGVPVHPTQLYSMFANALTGAVTLRLWAESAPCAVVAGVYLVLMGLGRFVEEAWRGEPQTPTYAGLRLYQWVGVGCLVAGAALTCVPGTPPTVRAAPSLEALWTALAVGAVVWFATSVDFPRSSRRFARLA